MMEEFEMIAGKFPYKRDGDYPFGKEISIGLKKVLVFDRLIESGYVCGVTAHQIFLEDHSRTEPALLDDRQLSMIIDELAPPECGEEEQSMWRGYFVAGWMSLLLGIEPDESLFSSK